MDTAVYVHAVALLLVHDDCCHMDRFPFLFPATVSNYPDEEFYENVVT